ncbi:UNVERIFIED_CONTAM: hypothetical protein Scaly_2033000 [Sesamum calycinum]|uniref:Uncharacterized protein n=1 Tax=Sesamum calycinum TaxID=2727403 RepID=A0AAW2N1M9_9LAMI
MLSGGPCSCNIAKATADLIEERHLMQFLMGLNDEYDGVRSQILVSEPLPSINKAYQMILRVERQHEVHINLNGPRDGAALYAGNSNRFKVDQSRGQPYKKRGLIDKRVLRCDNCGRRSGYTAL